MRRAWHVSAGSCSYNARMNRLRLLLTLLCVLSGTAGAREYAVAPDSDVVGEVELIRIADGDNFIRLARRFNVGYNELIYANPGVDPLIPKVGTEVVIPSRYVLPDAPREGIVLNVPEFRLYYFPADRPGRVVTHPISVGREGWRTPYGRTSVVRKQHLPSWTPPDSVREEHAARGDILPYVVGPGPDNPLGEHALYLAMPGYLIHGTNQPAGLGMRVSHGCIRMFPEDIASLFEVIDPGTPVTIVNQPYKLGWGEGGLYMEAHRPLNEEREDFTATELTRLYVAATQERRVQVRWAEAEAVMHAGNGMPEFVSVEGTITLADLSDEPLTSDEPAQ